MPYRQIIDFDAYNESVARMRLRDNAGSAYRILTEAEMSPQQVAQLPAPTGDLAYGYKNYADGAIATWHANYSSTVENVPQVNELVNSNYSGAAGQTNTFNWEFAADTDYSGGAGGGTTGGTFTARSASGGASGGATSFIQSSVMPAVAAAGLGISIGKMVDSVLYNANPDFWDNAGLSGLNPQTWDSLTMDMSDEGWEGINKRAFNAIFGINTQDKTAQMYIDQDAAAYLAQYMHEQGVFDSGTMEYELDEPTQGGYTLTISPSYGSISVLAKLKNNQEPEASVHSLTVTSGNAIPTVFIVSSTQAHVYFSSSEPFTITSTLDRYPSTHTPSVMTVDNKPVYYLMLTFYSTNYENSADVMSQISGYSGQLSQNMITPTTVGYTAYYHLIIAYGTTATQTQAVEGITNQDGATTPDFSHCATPQDYLGVLQQTYPDMFTNPVTQTVAQPDGSVVTHTYIPVGTPTGTGTQTTTNPDTTGQSQTNTQVDTSAATQELLQTIVDLIAKTTEQPPDTGDGDTPTVVPPIGQASSLFAIYNPTQAELNQFGGWLWSSNFVDQLLKLFNDPMQSIIGLHKIFAQPTISGTSTIHVGYLDSGISSNTVGAQYTDINCGSVKVSEQFGNVFDYSDTDVRLYLPFIGIVPLDVMDVMRGTVSIIYHVDVITGACLAEVRVARDASGGTLYQYAGDAAVRYPISSGSYMGVVSGVLGVVGGIASGIMSGGATLPLMAGAAGAMAGAKTHVQHSGSFAGNAGAMGAKKPYLILERPQTAIAKNYKAYQGIGANVVQSVGDMSGYFKMTDVRLNSITGASDSELESIRAALEQGVIA